MLHSSVRWAEHWLRHVFAGEVHPLSGIPSEDFPLEPLREPLQAKREILAFTSIVIIGFLYHPFQNNSAENAGSGYAQGKPEAPRRERSMPAA